MQNTTIIALSTPPGIGGIAIIRISGPKSLQIANKLIIESTLPNDWETRKLYNIKIRTNSFVEHGMGVVFRAPKSYTGEDLVELHVHGSMAIVRGIIRAAISHGATVAGRGEFSMRAFMSGKMDLTGAEGVRDLINSETDAQIAAAQSLVSGELYRAINSIQNTISRTLAQIEVIIDYPEEDITLPRDTLDIIKNLAKHTEKLCASYRTGELIKNGVKIAIIGEPNAGKSSLFNALLGRPRAIVNAQAGTTRDTIADGYIYKGVKFDLIDTAGLRETQCDIEREGITRTHEASKNADLTILVVDACAQNSNTSQALNPDVTVYNKSDLVQAKLAGTNLCDIAVSALKGHNIDNLKELLYTSSIGTEQIPALMLTSNRQYSAIEEAKDYLTRAYTALEANTQLDCVSVELFGAFKALGKATGKTAEADIISEIFESFCVGK